MLHNFLRLYKDFTRGVLHPHAQVFTNYIVMIVLKRFLIGLNPGTSDSPVMANNRPGEYVLDSTSDENLLFIVNKVGLVARF